MERITPKYRRWNIKKHLSSIVGALLIVLSIGALSLEVFADHGHDSTSGDTDDGSRGRPCTSGNCYSARKNGAFWVEVQANGRNFSQIFGPGSYAINNPSFANCPSTVYILVSRLGNGNIAGPVDINSVSTGSGNPGEGGAATNIHDYDGGWLPAGATGHSNSEAEAKFSQNQAFYNAPPYNQKFYGTNMGWFCADPNTTTTTTTTTTITWYDNCTQSRSRYIGQTVTRIAVRNRTLDDPVQDYHNNWHTTHGGLRYNIHNDSGWSSGGASVYTIAKPGDSVQFLHSFCAAARYVRRTTDQGVEWTSHEDHDQILDMQANHFRIKANADGYLFGDGISWVNGQTASITSYGPPDNGYIFPTDPPGSIASSAYVGATYRDEIGTLSPTANNNSYNCNGVSMYGAWGVPYVGGASFQIPGYDSGWSCNAATKSGISNTVGRTIQQWHEFNMIKSWEQWTHNEGGRCGCNSVNTAWFGGNFFSPEYGTKGNTWNKREDHTCKDSPSCTDCCWCCGGYDEYKHCLGGCDDNYVLTDESYHWSFQSKSKNYGEAKKVATVYVPYNFETSVGSRLDAGPTIFQGSAISSSFNWDVLPRVNQILANFGFATVTPGNTKVQFIEFIYSPGGHNVSGSQMSSAGPCAYYSGAEQCKVINTIHGNQNPEGFYQGKSGSASYTRTVPDDSEYVGYKYCVAMGFYPSDSHNYQGNTISNNMHSGYSGAMDAGEYWNISNASCRTIAKKPNTQVWNGSLYTEGKVTTSISKKEPNVHLGTDYNAGATSIFGSWADYSISAMGVVKGMSSGAVIGYDNSHYDLRGGGRATSQMNMRRLSPLTVANSGDSVGSGAVNASASIDVNLNRLKARYSDKAATYAASDGGSGITVRTAETGMQYVYYNGGGELYLSTIANHINSYGDVANHPNQTTHRSGSGIYKTLGDGVNDNTLVIYTNGKLVIDGNICLGSGCHGTGMTLRDYSYGTSTNSSAKLPQILIFAKNIAITENVTRVDAWLIAPNGNINTCKDYQVGSSLVAHDAYNRYGYGNCYKTLMVNGPIYAKSLTLNRTAGATHGVAPASSGSLLDRQYGATGASSDGNLGSQTPAEIFNLRADAYLWAYTQAQRYSEAVVTYMRELAPRY